MSSESSSSTDSPRGAYFQKKDYQPASALPGFADARKALPRPILDGNRGWLEMYWRCWELAFQHLRQPEAESGLVSDYLDAAFNGNVFQWDTIFMIMFARYGHRAFPAVQSLDNFYARQHASGFICREIRRDGSDFYFRGPRDAVNPPLFSWAEAESFRTTGDKSRFASVLPPLEKYVAWLNTESDPDHYDDQPDWVDKGRQSAGSVHRLYWNTPLGCGMDNAPRGGNGWVDMSCQMVIQYNDLATICEELGMSEKAAGFRQEATAISERINRWCWNAEDGFYYDVRNDGSQVRVKTSGGFWPLLAGITSSEQAERLVAHLKDETRFWRPFVFPTLAADEPDYTENGGYWLGAVWAPTNYAIIKGLERCGYGDFAAEAATRYLDGMEAVFRDTGTVWENYAPEIPFRPGDPAMKDFVGWTGIGPIALVIENILGLHCDGVNRRLEWTIRRSDRHGIDNLQLGTATVSVIAEARDLVHSPLAVTAVSTAEFTLVMMVNGQRIEQTLPPGVTSLSV